MTNEEAIEELKEEMEVFKEGIDAKALKNPNAELKKVLEANELAIKALEQTDKIEESNFSTEQYKADLQGAYDCGYNCGYVDAMCDIAETTL